jgi:hypothetical protein
MAISGQRRALTGIAELTYPQVDTADEHDDD